jgi:hypothetical protein
VADKTLYLDNDELDTIIDLVTNEIEALGRGEISYGSRDTDLNEAAHLTNIAAQLKTARDR